MSAARAIFRRCRAAVVRFHRDEQGGMMDYLLILAAVGIPLIVLSGTMMKILTNYYAMLAFHVGWPFL